MSVKIAAAIVLLMAVPSVASAERKQPIEKLSPRPVQPAPPPAASAQPGFIHSPWTKFCGRDRNSPKDICLTVKEARLETGQFVAGAALIEQAGAEKKLLRVTLPLGLQLMPGVRMFIDSEPPASGPYVLCSANGCMADFEVSADFVSRLKKGQQLQVQGINVPGEVARYLLPLADFAQAFEGPPTDPVKYERDQKQRRDQPPRSQVPALK